MATHTNPHAQAVLNTHAKELAAIRKVYDDSSCEDVKKILIKAIHVQIKRVEWFEKKFNIKAEVA